MAKEDNSKYKELRNYAWNYFQHHTLQRLTTFHFYILISSLTASGYFLAIKSIPVLAVALGVLLVLFSFVFWNLDCRNRQNINISIKALEYIENQDVIEEDEESRKILSIVTHDQIQTRESKENRILWWHTPLHYSTCLNIVFISFSVFGLVAIVFAVINLF